MVWNCGRKNAKQVVAMLHNQNRTCTRDTYGEDPATSRLVIFNSFRSPQSLCNTNHRARCFILALTVLRPAYTLPGGEPRMRETIASRAIFMFWNEPMIWIFLYDVVDVRFCILSGTESKQATKASDDVRVC